MHTGTSLYPFYLLIPYCPRLLIGHFPPLRSYKSPAITLFSVIALSAHLLQLLGTLFPTHSVHPVHTTLSGSTSKHTFTKQLLITPKAFSSASDSLM